MTSSTANHTATAGAIYQAFARGDVAFILDQLADDVAWDADWADLTGRRASLDHLRPRRGPAGAAEFFAIIAAWQVDAFQVHDLIGSGNQVVGEISAAFTLPNGGRFADEELHLWTFDDAGKVIRFRHYVDTAKHVAAAAGEDTTR